MPYGINDGIEVDFRDKLKAGGSRLQTAEPIQLFENRHNYGISTLLWETVTNTSAAGTPVQHLDNEAGVALNLTTTLNEEIVRQTFEHFLYTPSKPLKFQMAIIHPTAKAGLRTRVGAFTAGDGFFIEVDGTSGDDTHIKLVRRTSVTGSPVDTAVTKNNWNLDKLDGNGPSGKTLDLTKVNLFFVDYLWYGAGPIEYGFEIDGEPIIVHRDNTANSLTTPITSTGNLPLRFEIKNTTATGSNSTLKTYGASVVTEGGSTSNRGYFHTAHSGITTVVSAANQVRTHAISVRPKTTFQGIENRVRFELESIEVAVTGSHPVYWEVLYGQAYTNSPTWDSAGPDSAFEINNAVSSTPAIVDNNAPPSSVGPSGLVLATNQIIGSTRVEARNILPICLDAAGNTRQDGTLTVVVQSTTTGSSNCFVVLNWREIY